MATSQPPPFPQMYTCFPALPPVSFAAEDQSGMCFVLFFRDPTCPIYWPLRCFRPHRQDRPVVFVREDFDELQRRHSAMSTTCASSTTTSATADTTAGTLEPSDADTNTNNPTKPKEIDLGGILMELQTVAGLFETERNPTLVLLASERHVPACRWTPLRPLPFCDTAFQYPFHVEFWPECSRAVGGALFKGKVWPIRRWKSGSDGPLALSQSSTTDVYDLEIERALTMTFPSPLSV